MRIDLISIFPDYFAPLRLSLVGKAIETGILALGVHDLRDFTHDRHRTVDDTPYGGGAGMVMKPEPFFEAVEGLECGPPIVLLSPRGRTFTQADAFRFAAGPELTLLHKTEAGDTTAVRPSSPRPTAAEGDCLAR